MTEQSDAFVADCLALKDKHRMSDIEYAGSLAGWFIAFCVSRHMNPVSLMNLALVTCEEEENEARPS